MNRRWRGFSMVILAVVLAAGSARAGSIWRKGHARTQSILTDDTARNVGDVLTITIDEKSEITNQTSRKLDKADTRSMKTSGTIKTGDVLPSMLGKTFDLPQVDANLDGKSNFDGSANFDSSRKVTDQISVVVEDVLPNGNLLVLGKRTREVAGDEQVIQVSGIVRPSDLSYDNSIKSEKVAEFHIVYKRKGQEKSFFNPGWFARILNLLNPF